MANNQLLCSGIPRVRNSGSAHQGQRGPASSCVGGLIWVLGRPGAEVTCRLIHSRGWCLMLAVDWDLSCGPFLSPGFLTKWSRVSKVSVPRASRWKLLSPVMTWNHTVTSPACYWPRKLVSGRRTQTPPMEGGVTTLHWRKNLWEQIRISAFILLWKIQPTASTLTQMMTRKIPPISWGGLPSPWTRKWVSS